MNERSDLISKIIANWINNQEGVYTFWHNSGNYDEPKEDPLIIGVDGPIDCRKLAAAIDQELGGSSHI